MFQNIYLTPKRNAIANLHRRKSVRINLTSIKNREYWKTETIGEMPITIETFCHSGIDE